MPKQHTVAMSSSFAATATKEEEEEEEGETTPKTPAEDPTATTTNNNNNLFVDIDKAIDEDEDRFSSLVQHSSATVDPPTPTPTPPLPPPPSQQYHHRLDYPRTRTSCGGSSSSSSGGDSVGDNNNHNNTQSSTSSSVATIDISTKSYHAKRYSCVTIPHDDSRLLIKGTHISRLLRTNPDLERLSTFDPVLGGFTIDKKKYLRLYKKQNHQCACPSCGYILPLSFLVEGLSASVADL